MLTSLKHWCNQEFSVVSNIQGKNALLMFFLILWTFFHLPLFATFLFLQPIEISLLSYYFTKKENHEYK